MRDIRWSRFLPISLSLAATSIARRQLQDRLTHDSATLHALAHRDLHEGPVSGSRPHKQDPMTTRRSRDHPGTTHVNRLKAM